MIYVLIGLALIFDFLNGVHDSSNVVATPISSGAIPPRRALLLAAAANFIGPFLFGVAVATTIGDDLLVQDAITTTAVIAGLVGAIVWNIFTWYAGLPSSSSHALIGGLVGAALVESGLQAIQLAGLTRIVIALLVSPILGMGFGYVVMSISLFASRGATPKINHFFRRAQYGTLIGLALSHGTNDAQKTMGVITLGLVTSGMLETFEVPTWVIFICATAIALGTALGGWRLIRTLGGKIFRIRPIHGFTSQLAGAAVIMGAAIAGGPVSTTQVMSTSIMGVGAAERANKVRWMVLRDLMAAWLLTIPAAAMLSGVTMWLILAFA
ncbi:MAG: inorganic phosphate transporter [Anaerolineales bacterium]|nr:inorganic phosphate transporter [Anaerolineales bacterium]